MAVLNIAADFLCLRYQQQVPAFWLQAVFVPVTVGCVPDHLVREMDTCFFASYCLAPLTLVKHSQMKWGDLGNAGLAKGVLVSESWRTWCEAQGPASALNLLTPDTNQVNHLGFGFLCVTAGTLKLCLVVSSYRDSDQHWERVLWVCFVTKRTRSDATCKMTFCFQASGSFSANYLLERNGLEITQNVSAGHYSCREGFFCVISFCHCKVSERVGEDLSSCRRPHFSVLIHFVNLFTKQPGYRLGLEWKGGSDPTDRFPHILYPWWKEFSPGFTLNSIPKLAGFAQRVTLRHLAEEQL